jgi:hypothetical protein
MKHIVSSTFTADRAWGSLPIASMNGRSVKLHWTDQPYRWHVNDGEEVFAVMDGEVLMFILLQHSVVFYIVALLLLGPRDGVVLTFLVLPDSVVLDLV